MNDDVDISLDGLANDMRKKFNSMTKKDVVEVAVNLAIEKVMGDTKQELVQQPTMELPQPSKSDLNYIG